LANLKASLFAAEGAVLNRVASLRGILGLPPGSDFTIVPTTPPLLGDVEFDWESLVQLAEENRPDLVELKLVLDADQQRILQARNRAQPQLDAVALYRWNGLEGEMPIGERLRADPGEHTDWSLAVNFSVPFTLRAERADLRQNELLLAADRANLQQGLLSASHDIAFTLRTIDQLQQQYVAFQNARSASQDSLALQSAEFGEGRTTFLDFLLAVNTWANSVTSEAGSVTQLNTTLADLEFQTGTILETHGIRLFEERYCALGPLGPLGKGREYPSAMRPSDNVPRYERGSRPSEESFNLKVVEPPRTTRLPPPEPGSR
jgi:outer membrane protein TolC